MEQKFQVWFKELNSLTPEEDNNECQKMKLEVQAIEFKLFIHFLMRQIKELKKQVEQKQKGLEEARELLRMG